MEVCGVAGRERLSGGLRRDLRVIVRGLSVCGVVVVGLDIGLDILGRMICVVRVSACILFG